MVGDLFEIMRRKIEGAKQEEVCHHLDHSLELTNFLCSALLQIDARLAIGLRQQLVDQLKMWNSHFTASVNSLEPSGHTRLLDTTRMCAILLGASINAQLMAPQEESESRSNFAIINPSTWANKDQQHKKRKVIKFEAPLAAINDYSDEINLSDLAVKLLQEDLTGLRIKSSIDPMLYNLAFGEKLFEEAESAWTRLFEHDSTTTLPGGVNEPDFGGRKMIRLTRVLLAGLLNHAKVDSNQNIHRQIFHQRSKLIQRKQNSQTDVPDQDSTTTIVDEEEIEMRSARNEQHPPLPLHPFFQSRTRRISEQNGPTKRARKITDDTQIYLPLMKKALYLLLCINSTSERLPALERTSSGSASNLSNLTTSDSAGDLARQLLQDKVAGSRRGSLNSGLRLSQSENSVVLGRPNPKTVGERLRREKEKQSQRKVRKDSSAAEEKLAKLIVFLNDEDADPERMLNGIKGEENLARQRINALQYLNKLLESDFLDRLSRHSSRTFLAAVFGLIQNPLQGAVIHRPRRLRHYLADIENARTSLQNQITKLWRELSVRLLTKTRKKDTLAVYATCGLSLLWQESDMQLVETISYVYTNTESEDEQEKNKLVVFTPQLILQMNSGQLKLENLHQIASIGIVQSLLLSISAYATSDQMDLVEYIMSFMLGQLNGIWKTRGRRRETFELCLADLLALINRFRSPKVFVAIA